MKAEKLGAFYLGRPYDLEEEESQGRHLFFTTRKISLTHAVCVGMTGSGKTGLCIALLEEAAIDGIPAIVIDPKGDLANLLLTFPELRAGGLSRRGSTRTTRGRKASRRASSPRSRRSCGRRAWRVGARTARASSACATRPTSRSTRRAATPGFRSRSSSRSPRRQPSLWTTASCCASASATTATSLLGLLGIDADPIQSREHILLSTLLEQRLARRDRTSTWPR